jgi:hypothetical protein
MDDHTTLSPRHNVPDDVFEHVNKRQILSSIVSGILGDPSSSSSTDGGGGQTAT